MKRCFLCVSFAAAKRRHCASMIAGAVFNNRLLSVVDSAAMHRSLNTALCHQIQVKAVFLNGCGVIADQVDHRGVKQVQLTCEAIAY